MLLALIANSLSTFSKEYSHDFKNIDFRQSNTAVLDGVEWTLTTDGAVAGSWDEKNLHYGSGSKEISYLTLSTSAIKGEIASIKVVADCALRLEATLEVQVGEISFAYLGNFKATLKANNGSDTSFDFRGSSSGEISIKLSYAKKTKNALYIGKVVITYDDGTEEVIRLDEAADNDTAIMQAVSSGKQAVELHRTLSPDYWNTFCVPFAISAEAINRTFGSAEIHEFSGRVEDGVMIFTKVDTIKAGVPYLIKPTNKVENPKFGDVAFTVSVPSAVNDESGKYAYIGIYSPYTMATDGTEQFLGDGDKLLKPLETDRTMFGMRAYFRLPATQSQAKIAIADVPTAITLPHAQTSRSAMKKGVYTIGGQYVGKTAQGLPQGIYIVNGQKIAIK